MRRLLVVATWLCGESARDRVFEPLLADWSRELRDAAPQSPLSRAAVFISGALAFTLTLFACGLRHALAEDTGMWKYGAVTFVLAATLAIVLEASMIYYSIPPDYPPDLLLIAAMRFSAGKALALAMLPALFLLRRDSRAGLGKATAAIVVGTAIVALGVVSQSWFESYQPSASQNERMYQRMRANDLAGRVSYPGTAVRELRDATSTPEQRKARYEQFRGSVAQQRANAPPPPTPWQRLTRSNTTVLAVLFGVIGWMLGGLARPTLPGAIAGWAVVSLLVMLLDDRLSTMLGLPGFGLSWWTLPAVAAALALALANRSTDRSPAHQIISS
jgi:hypothetical protein